MVVANGNTVFAGCSPLERVFEIVKIVAVLTKSVLGRTYAV